VCALVARLSCVLFFLYFMWLTLISNTYAFGDWKGRGKKAVFITNNYLFKSYKYACFLPFPFWQKTCKLAFVGCFRSDLLETIHANQSYDKTKWHFFFVFVNKILVYFSFIHCVDDYHQLLINKFLYSTDWMYLNGVSVYYL